MNLEAQLIQLEKIALVRRVEENEPTYFFRHTLTQESIYHSLLKPLRRETHRAVARAYEELYADRLDDYTALLAEHYAAAQEDAKTFEYSVRAGDAAMRVYASAEVITHFSRAIEIALRAPNLGDSAVLSPLYLKRGRVMETSGRLKEALKNYEEMETIAHQRDDRAMELAALVALATIHSTASIIYDEQHARTLSNLALGLAREIGDRQTEARVLWNLMLLSSSIGEMEQAVTYGEESLVISRELGMREQTANTLNDLFRPYNSLGRFDQARIVLEEAREHFRAVGNQAMLADNLTRSSLGHMVFGEFDLALKASEEACQIGEAMGNPWSQSFSQMFTGIIYFERGEMTRAMETMSASIHLGQVAGFLMPQIWTKATLATLYGELGNVEQGVELASEALAVATERFPHGMRRIYEALARLFLLRGDVRQAESYADQGKAKPVNDFAQRAFDRLPLVEIQVELAKKDFTRVIQLADQLQGSASPIYVRVFQSELGYLKGKALLALGDAESARQVWLQALSEAEKIGSRWMQWQIYAALGERERAREMVEFIAEHTPDDSTISTGTSLRAAFMNLPSVRGVIG